MATRKRKPADKKLPAFKMTRIQEHPEENDLKKLKAQTLAALKETKEKEKEWYDNEMDKNLKKQ